MRNSILRAMRALSAAAVLACCGGAGDDRGLCMGLAPEKPGNEGCDNVVLNLATHPCQREVEQACGEVDDGSSCAVERMTNCATNYYLRSYAPENLPDCDSSKPVIPIDAELMLSLYRYSNISDGNTVRHTQGLQRYYAPFDLMMTTDAIVAPERIRYALGGTEAELTQALIDAGLNPSATSLTPEEEALATRVVGDVIFAPTKAFFQRHSIPVQAKVNIVVIDQIVSPGVTELMGLEGTIVGLGLSPALIANLGETDADAASLNTMLQTDGDFTPTLFVGHSDIARLSGNFDVVVAHEMGHALGLPHVEDEGNLMQQGGSHRCRRWLDQEQVDLMGPFADVTATPEDALSRLLIGQRNLLRNLLARRRAVAPKK